MFGTKIRRFPSLFTPIIRRQTNIATNLQNTNSDGVTKASNDRTLRDKHLSNITVTSFYSQTAIEQLAAKVDRVTC